MSLVDDLISIVTNVLSHVPQVQSPDKLAIAMIAVVTVWLLFDRSRGTDPS